MEKRLWMALAAALGISLAFAPAGVAMAQEGHEEQPDQGPKDKPQNPDGQDDEGLTPAEAAQALEESLGLMRKAEELLADSTKGKLLETDEEIQKRIAEELKGIEGAVIPQKDAEKIMQKAERLMKRAENRQKAVVDKLKDLLSKLRA